MDEIGRFMDKVSIVQEQQDLSCNCTECYWNLWNPSYNKPYYASDRAKQCVSESLGDFKMTPNSTDCEGYWSYEEACGRKKGE